MLATRLTQRSKREAKGRAAEGRPISIDSIGLTYDAQGRMVEQQNGSSYTQVLYGPLIPVGLWLGWPRALASNAALAVVVGVLVTVTVALVLRCYSRRWLLPWLVLQTVGNAFAVAGMVAGMLRSYDMGNALLGAAFGSWILGFIALVLGGRGEPTTLR